MTQLFRNNKLMHLKIFSVSSQHIYSFREENKLKLTGLGENGRPNGRERVSNQRKWIACKIHLVLFFRLVISSHGAQWGHRLVSVCAMNVSDGRKWRHWFAMRSWFISFSLYFRLWTELNFDTRTKNDTHSNSSHFNTTLFALLLPLLVLMCFFFRRNDR